jgi:hypothetical protein
MKKKTILVPLTVLLASAAAFAQTASISGALASFEIVNDSGKIAHGFEIQLEGATQADLYYTSFGGRYGMPAIVPYATGVNIRYVATYAGAKWSATTPVANTVTFAWQDCYQGGAGYATSGCENFGQSLRRSAGITPTGYWLVENPAAPGQLVRADPPATIPFGTWSVFAGPALGITIAAPVKAPPAQFGDAIWMKVFKTSLPKSVTGDQLVLSHPDVVPEAAAQVETNWTILQKAPPGTQNRRGKGTHIASSPLSITDASHVRRVETYKYTGTYDPLTHEVTCADGVCNAPAAGELGAALSANNTAANAVADSLTVTKSGSGSATGNVTIGGLKCGAASCANFGTNGATVALTADPGSAAFGGWTGACSGTGTSCTVVINGKTQVDANFLKVFTLSVGRSNSGAVAATPSGRDRALSCGSTCSAKFADGTAVVLTATPVAGKTFLNWTGGCTGTALTCAINITKDTSVNAVFSK